MKILKRSGKRAPDSRGVVIRQTHHSPRPQKWWHLRQCLVSVVLATRHLWTVLLPGTSERRRPKGCSRSFDQDKAQPEVQVGWDLSVVRVKILTALQILFICVCFTPLSLLWEFKEAGTAPGIVLPTEEAIKPHLWLDGKKWHDFKAVITFFSPSIVLQTRKQTQKG